MTTIHSTPAPDPGPPLPRSGTPATYTVATGVPEVDKVAEHVGRIRAELVEARRTLAALKEPKALRAAQEADARAFAEVRLAVRSLDEVPTRENVDAYERKLDEATRLRAGLERSYSAAGAGFREGLNHYRPEIDAAIAERTAAVGDVVEEALEALRRAIAERQELDTLTRWLADGPGRRPSAAPMVVDLGDQTMRALDVVEALAARLEVETGSLDDSVPVVGLVEQEPDRKGRRPATSRKATAKSPHLSGPSDLPPAS